MLTFQELTEARRSLRGFCLLHEPSLLRLKSGVSFKLLPGEPDLGVEKVRHLTTTATCLTSLFDCPAGFRTVGFGSIENLKSIFAEKALERSDWMSEDSAGIYCRCRALPTVIDLSDANAGAGLDKRIEAHIATILRQLDIQSERFGIGEADPAYSVERWYPPNAFHTYWVLDILAKLECKYKADYQRLSDAKALNLKQRRNGMLLWARRTLGSQLGLHSASPQSSILDSDQLAWSLGIFLLFDQTLTVNLENRDLIKQALKGLFSTQTDGTWRHYKPLFHYLDVGNAYCYVFETFAALLRSALHTGDKVQMIRELLKPYCKNLIELWRYAESTKIDLGPYIAAKKDASSTGNEIGWCSGHRTNVTEPESWATASVFSYAQALRRLVGIWCREEALNNLKAPRIRFSAEIATKEMLQRGRTWETTKNPVSDQLWTMFVNPIRMHTCDDKLEPDSQPIEEKHARSAILFGPPGTSKTTLVGLLADVAGWDYVELHASHFVAEGLAAVQKTADRIFKQLLELDHTVVLFDEIDELVREREMEGDAFGRFLTTSMLPKLAELWKGRKIIYFVATNHINYFDSAIIRSHRFDALILVSPPSFDAKSERLNKLLLDAYRSFTLQAEVEQEIRREFSALIDSAPKASQGTNENGRAAQRQAYSEWLEEPIKSDFALAKFLLLRYDELDELAYHLPRVLMNKSDVTKTISADSLRESLTQIADSQWRKNKSYADYARDEKSQRRDYQMVNVWEVRGNLEISVPGVVFANGSKWLARAIDSLKDFKVPDCELIPVPPGGVQIRALVPK